MSQTVKDYLDRIVSKINDDQLKKDVARRIESYSSDYLKQSLDLLSPESQMKLALNTCAAIVFIREAAKDQLDRFYSLQSYYAGIKQKVASDEQYISESTALLQLPFSDKDGVPILAKGYDIGFDSKYHDVMIVWDEYQRAMVDESRGYQSFSLDLTKIGEEVADSVLSSPPVVEVMKKQGTSMVEPERERIVYGVRRVAAETQQAVCRQAVESHPVEKVKSGIPYPRPEPKRIEEILYRNIKQSFSIQEGPGQFYQQAINRAVVSVIEASPQIITQLSNVIARFSHKQLVVLSAQLHFLSAAMSAGLDDGDLLRRFGHQEGKTFHPSFSPLPHSQIK